jgi:NAD(P)-dependent dehydrogenase (short-subunit alcohol dehydrogenase family)
VKAWFVTGASRGLGLAVAEAALARGDLVAAAVRDTVAIEPLVAQFGDRLLPLQVDVTDRPGVAAAVSRARETFQRLDVVVNNAGSAVLGAVEEASEEEARAQLETNFFGALWVTQAALPHLRAQRGGHVVQISSVGGVAGFPMVGLYNASKFALEGLSEALAQEVAEFGIKVTLVEPGALRTDWPQASLSLAAPVDAYANARAERLEAMADEYEGRQPGDPRRVAAAILELVDAPRPPLRLLAGSGAFDVATARLRSQLAEWAAWEQTARATDFPVDEAAAAHQ